LGQPCRSWRARTLTPADGAGVFDCQWRLIRSAHD
jgi:hypothetical protein